MRNIRAIYLLLTLIFLLSGILGSSEVSYASSEITVEIEASYNGINNENGSEDVEESRGISSVVSGYWLDFKGWLYHAFDSAAEKSFSPKVYRVVKEGLDVIFKIQVLFLSFLFAIGFLFNLLVVSVVIILSSFYKGYIESLRARLISKYEDVLIKYLFEEMEINDAAKKLSSKRRLRKNILIGVLYNYQQNLSGEYKDRVLELYARMGLYKLSKKKTRSIFPYKRVKGVRELVTLYPSGAKKIITRLIKNKDSVVRNEALISSVYLDEEIDFSFIKGIKGNFSDWVQLNILSYLKTNEKTVPSFNEYLTFANSDVQNFAIRMVDYFQQNENEEALIDLIDHPEEKTRCYVYRAIRELGLISALEKVKSKFNDETKKNKTEILSVIQELGGDSDFNFLRDILYEQDDVRLKLNVCSALYGMGEKGQNVLKEYSETVDAGIVNYVEHVKEKRN